jgi:hypothetical protein
MIREMRFPAIVSRVAAVTVGVACLAVAVGSGQTNARGNNGQRIKVMAVDDRTQRRVPKAHVSVVNADGKQIAEAWTDDSGIAELRSISGTERPKYLFVQAEWTFITGREWIPGQLEYRTPVISLTPPAFGG